MDTKSFSNKTKGNNSKRKIARVVVLVCDTSSCPVLFYISTKYHPKIPKGIQITERTRIFKPTLRLTPTPTASVPKTTHPSIEET